MLPFRNLRDLYIKHGLRFLSEHLFPSKAYMEYI